MKSAVAIFTKWQVVSTSINAFSMSSFADFEVRAPCSFATVLEQKLQVKEFVMIVLVVDIPGTSGSNLSIKPAPILHRHLDHHQHFHHGDHWIFIIYIPFENTATESKYFPGSNCPEGWCESYFRKSLVSRLFLPKECEGFHVGSSTRGEQQMHGADLS